MISIYFILFLMNRDNYFIYISAIRDVFVVISLFIFSYFLLSSLIERRFAKVPFYEYEHFLRISYYNITQ